MRRTRSTIASVYSEASSSFVAKRERRHTSRVSGCFLLIVFHVKEIVGCVYECERRADLREGHFLLAQLDFGNGLAPVVAARHFAVAVCDGVAQHFGGDVENHGDVGYFEIYARVFLDVGKLLLGEYDAIGVHLLW